MKKLTLIICFLVLAQFVIGQDIIIKKTGDEIKGKVTEITSTEIKYKKADNMDVIYSISKSEVFMIKYQNGTNEVINQITTTTTTNTTNNNKDQNSSVLTKRKAGLAGFLSFLYPGIGQFYNRETLKGIIYMSLYTADAVLFLVAPMDLYYSSYSGYYYYSLSTTHYIALISAGADLVLSVIDASISASKINKANGFANLYNNKKINLNLKPEIKYSFANNNVNTKLVPVFGAKLSLTIN